MNKVIQFFSFLILLLSTISQVFALETLNYQLKPKKIANDTYVFIGVKEDFSRDNGGNIVNTGFIVTERGVIVIDTGSSYRYGQQMRQAISKITNKPIIKVLITHHHPDHFLGNQAYNDVPIYALANTIELLKRDANGFLDNVYRMTGSWMSGTEVSISDIKPLLLIQEQVTNHSLRYFPLRGHTASDLVILDETTGVLFTGDLVFHNRAPTTPHAEPKSWLMSLDAIREIDYTSIVPGHGEVSAGTAPIDQTRDYLVWLETTIQDAVNKGLEMNEVLVLPIPENFRDFAVVRREFTRSVTHRYPIYEKLLFKE